MPASYLRRNVNRRFHGDCLTKGLKPRLVVFDPILPVDCRICPSFRFVKPVFRACHRIFFRKGVSTPVVVSAPPGQARPQFARLGVSEILRGRSCPPFYGAAQRRLLGKTKFSGHNVKTARLCFQQYHRRIAPRFIHELTKLGSFFRERTL